MKSLRPGLSSELPKYGVLWILLIITLFPFYMLLITSFKNREQVIHNFWLPTWPLKFENYTSAFDQIYQYLINSMIVTSGIIVGVVIISSLAAYSFTRFDYPGKTFLFMSILSLMMIPGFLLLIPQFLWIQKLGMLNSYEGQIFPPLAAGAAMSTLLMRSFFEGLPRSLFEAAELEGAGEVRIFLRIVVPLSMPIIATVAIINGLSGWNNYIWPLVITSGDTVKPVILALDGLLGTIEQGISIKLAGYVIASAPLVLLFTIATKPFISGLTSGAIKG